MAISKDMLNLNYMRRRKKSFWLLVFCLLSLASLAYIIFFLSPSSQLHLPLEALEKWGITNYQLPILPLFFALLFSFLFFIFYFLFNIRRGLFSALFVTTYLLLRFFHLTHIFFLIILISLFVTFDLLFRNRK